MPFSMFFPAPPGITSYLFSVFLDLLLIVFIPLSTSSILELLWPLSFSMLAHHWGSIIKMAWDAWPLRHLQIMTQFYRAWESRACPTFPQTPSFLSHAPFCPQSLCCLWGDALHLAECLFQIPGAFRCRWHGKGNFPRRGPGLEAPCLLHFMQDSADNSQAPPVPSTEPMGAYQGAFLRSLMGTAVNTVTFSTSFNLCW